MSRILAISDTQAPFQHPDAYHFIHAVDQAFRCDTYVHLGDEVDQHTLSVKFTPSRRAMSGQDEAEKAMEFMKLLYKRFPLMKVCVSNHTERYLKKAQMAGIPDFFLKQIRDAYQAPDGWSWDYMHIIDGIAFMHGMGVGGQYGHIKAMTKNRRSTVIGHLANYAGINYLNNFEGELLFGMNGGCLIDVDSYAMEYGRDCLDKPTIGTPVIINQVPIFVPMKMDKFKRWTGQL